MKVGPIVEEPMAAHGMLDAEPHPTESAAAADDPHTAACVKHDAFDVGYDESRPIDVDATGGFDVGRTERDDR
jgi:peptide/nickel transport system ATP-binding protein